MKGHAQVHDTYHKKSLSKCYDVWVPGWLRNKSCLWRCKKTDKHEFGQSNQDQEA